MPTQQSSFLNHVDHYLENNNKYVLKQSECNLVKSFNEKGINFVDDTTKILIVGTLTPQNVSRETGYYYMSESSNQIQYKIIDTIRKTKLVDEKKKNKVENIQKILHDEGIALLDVIEKAYVKPESSNDNHIYPLELADKYFKSIKHPEKIIAICNSNNAYECLLKIAKINNITFKNIVMCSQVQRLKGGFEARVIEWTPFLKK